MTVSRLIEELQDFLKTFGDLDVEAHYEDPDDESEAETWFPIRSVEPGGNCCILENL